MIARKFETIIVIMLLLMGCSLPALFWTATDDVVTPPPTVSSFSSPLKQFASPVSVTSINSTDIPLSSGNSPITPIPEPSWKIHHNEEYGFSFAYPAVYDVPQYQACKLRVIMQPDGIEYSMGYRSILTVQQEGDMDIQVYVNNWVGQKQATGALSVESQNVKEVAGSEAVEVNYRFGGTNRFGTATFLSQKGLLLTFNFESGTFCDVPDINLTEGQAYAKWVDSLKFDE